MSQDRYLAFLERRGLRPTVLNGSVFRRRNQMIQPFAAAAETVFLTGAQADDLLHRLGGAFVRWSDGLDRGPAERSWYSVVCDGWAGLSGIPSSNTRSKIRRGLKRCRVERIEPEYMARHGYQPYLRAFERYRAAPAIRDQHAFQQLVRIGSDFPDIVHYWGVFYGNDLAGYSENLIFGDVEVNYSEIKFDPTYLRHYSSYALIYSMTEHYLTNGFQYVNGGQRTLLHETDFQRYLVEQFRFREAPMNVFVHYRQPYSLLVKSSYPLRRVVRRLDRRLEAVYELERLRRISSPRRGLSASG